MKLFLISCAVASLAACGGTTATASGADTGSSKAGDVASKTDDTTSTADTGTAADAAAAPKCTSGISMTGAPAFMGTCFDHSDPAVNPKPVETSQDGNTSVEFTQRAASAPNTLILTVAWDSADPTALKSARLATGTAGYSYFDVVKGCGLGCKADSQGVGIDAAKRTITFTKTIVYRYNLTGGKYDTPVTLNGTLTY